MRVPNPGELGHTRVTYLTHVKKLHSEGIDSWTQPELIEWTGMSEVSVRNQTSHALKAGVLSYTMDSDLGRLRRYRLTHPHQTVGCWYRSIADIYAEKNGVPKYKRSSVEGKYLTKLKQMRREAKPCPVREGELVDALDALDALADIPEPTEQVQLDLPLTGGEPVATYEVHGELRIPSPSGEVYVINIKDIDSIRNALNAFKGNNN